MTAAFRMPDSFYEPLAERELTDEVATQCLGDYPETDTDDAYTCTARTQCSGCGGVVCTEHDDDVEDCSEGPAHAVCHAQGCSSVGCAQDRYEAHLMDRAEMERDER